MREKYSPKELEVQGNVLRAVPLQDLHLAEPAHQPNPEYASFEDLLHLRYELEAKIAHRRGYRQLPSARVRMERRTIKPNKDERYDELSLSTVREEHKRRTLRSHLSIT